MLTQWFFFLICVIYCIEQHIISDAHTCCCVFFLLLSLSLSLYASIVSTHRFLFESICCGAFERNDIVVGKEQKRFRPFC